MSDNKLGNMRYTYAEAGVDIAAGNALVRAIAPLARATRRAGADADLGGFGGFFDLRAAGFSDPLLVAANDGVGTKLKLAIEAGRHGGVGIDLVAMCANDLIVQGAEPLFFLDYYGCGKLDQQVAVAVIAGIAEGCRQAGCALIGGETAEMPGMYPAGEYDLAGFAVGVVEKSKAIDGKDIAPGDVVLGLASSGAHSNGYSLVRKIIERSNPDMNAKFDGERTLADVVMAPTRIYVKQVLATMEKVTIKGMAHITGGGLLENVPRVLPENTVAEIRKAAWPRPKLFDWMQQEGNVAEKEMHRTFNCGIGLVIVVAAADAEAAMAELKAQGEAVYNIGVIRARQGDEAQTVVV